MKLPTMAALTAILCTGTVFPAVAENVVGTVKAWSYMQADGWKSADGLDDNTLHNALYQARVIDNYPWTRQFLLRERGGGAYFLADKKNHTVRRLTVKPASGYYSDLNSVYQGEGNSCGFTLIDTQIQTMDAAQQRALMNDNPEVPMKQVRAQFAPKSLMTIPDNCVNPKQQAVLAAKRSEDDRKLQQWVAKQSMAELCRRTGNC